MMPPSLASALTLSLAAIAAIACATFLPRSPDDRAASATQDPKPGDPVRLLISGSMLGRLEPCGCASGQLGGLARRMQHIGENRAYDVLIEGGDLVDSATELDLMKWFTAIQILFGERPYDALGVGSKDLALPLDQWCGVLATAPVVASDLTSTRPDWPCKPFVEKQVRGHTVRVASLTLQLPPSPASADSEVKLLPAADGWKRGLEGAGDETLRVLLLHTDETTVRKLVPQFQPAPDLVVCFDRGFVEPSGAAQSIGGVPLVFAGIRGRVLLEVALERLADGRRATCSLVPLAGSKTLPGGGGDPTVKAVLLAHRDEVKEQGVLAKVARQKPTPNGAAYVGSRICQGCHPSAWSAYEKMRHFHAWETLEKAEKDPKRYGWPVTAYPDCVSCHVVGFEEKTGFVTYEETPDLSAVGCERCHGPGSDHIQAPATKKLGIHGGVMPSELCVQCHDFEQSPDFLYGNKWPLIQHGREPSQARK